MEIYKHESHIVYKIRKKIVVMRYINQKLKFYHKGIGFINWRFSIRPHKEFRYFHWFIRIPFFFCEKKNGGFTIGSNKLNIWFIT